MGCKRVEIHVDQDRVKWRAFVNMVRTSGFHKYQGNSIVTRSV